MQAYSLYSLLETEQFSNTEIIVTILAVPLLILIQIAICIMGIYIANQNMNTVCDMYSLFRVSTILYVSSAIGLVSFIIGSVYFYSLIKKNWKNVCLNILMIFINLLAILWSVVNIMTLLSTTFSCKDTSTLLWYSGIGIFIGEWVSCISYVTFTLFLIYK